MPHTLPDRVRFGAFELDLETGELLQQGRRVVLQQQPLRILRMLVEQRGGVVNREEIRKELWPNDTVVDFEHSINAAIKKLRQALGDSAEQPTYIETLARRGYRLMVAVERIADSSSGADASATGRAKPLRLEPSPGLIGQVVSHYRVLEVIGGGGMGMVYRAEDLKLGRHVALKFLPEELARDPVALQRFEREARTASSLSHPNICTIFEVEEYADQPVLVMELLEGVTLRERLAITPDKALPLHELLTIAMQICDGLEAAHEKGIVHRDIKPANIFLTSGQAKLLDFGLAKLTRDAKELPRRSVDDAPEPDVPNEPGGQQLPTESLEDTLTRVGATVGTAAYMSPEQVRGEKLDARTDLFSFGLVLYEMATGKRGFTGATSASLQDAVLTKTPLPLRTVNPELPQALQQVVQKCLEKNRELRYQHAADIRTDLAAIDRQMRQSYVRRHWKAVLAGLFAVAALIAGFLYQRPPKATPIREKDTVVIADFANSTNDHVFDGTLKQALSVALNQSPFLNVLSDNKVAATLRLMARPIDTAVTPDVARELCQRAGCKAYIVGSIAGLGNQYVIGLEAVDCQTGDVLAQQQVTVDAREKVLSALGAAAAKLRGQMGESLPSVARFNAPLAEATTSSLEALQAFSQGLRLGSQGESAVIPYFEKAIELDPNFAMAYAGLGDAYYNLNQEDLSARNFKKAYDLRFRVSQRERLTIEGYYYAFALGDLHRAVQSYISWSELYPNDYRPFAVLGNLYTKLGEYDKADTAMAEQNRLTTGTFVNANQVLLYVVMNRPDKAKALLEEARTRKFDDPPMHQARYMLAFLQADSAAMLEQVAWAKQQPGVEDWMLSAQSDTEAYHGRFAKARDLSQSAVASAKRAGAAETAADWEVNEALREAEVGNFALARQKAGEALALSSERSVKVLAALTLARTGESSQAADLADEVSRELPLDTIVQEYWLPLVRASMALAKQNPQQAVAALQPASSYELGTQPPFNVGPMYPVYLRGQAMLQAGQARAAAAEFQKMLDNPGISGNFVLAALARLQLARAQAVMGDATSARRSYQNFLTAWKDADPDLPIYQQAKAEYAKLP